MSDERQAGDGRQGQPNAPKWGDPISDERKRELEGILAAWEALPEGERGKRKGPFEGVSLTGADVFWLAVRVLAEQEGTGAGQRAIEHAEVRLRQAGESGILREPLSLHALHLEQAGLNRAHLEGAYLGWAHLEGAYLQAARLDGTFLPSAHLERAKLAFAHLERAYLVGTQLKQADLENVHLDGAFMDQANLERAGLRFAHLTGARLEYANLEHAYLWLAHLNGTDLANTHLEGAYLRQVRLDTADLRGAVLDAATQINDATLTGARVADMRWGSTNLTVVDWELVPELGDERAARAWKPKKIEGSTREERAKRNATQEKERLDTFKAAVRANRQLATALQDQGMNEEAANYAERAQRLQRRVLRLQGKRGRAAWSWFLDALAGYGYRPGRTVAWYMASIGVFAVLYFLASRGYITFGLKPSQFVSLPWYEALVLSVSSFHGRGFFQPVNSLGDPVAILAALEAVVGLVIEVSFIATFTQRFFGTR